MSQLRSAILSLVAGPVTVMLGAPSAAHAADDNWSNPAANYQQWTTGTNWDLGAAPTAAQTAAIANNGWAKIDSVVTFNSLTIGGTSQLQLLDGANLSGGGAITNNNTLTTLNSSALTVSNAIGGSGSLTVGGSGSLTLTGVNSYTGTTNIAAGSTLAMSGGGTIVNSSVNVTGTFDISQVTTVAPGSPPYIDIKSLTGSGTVALGSKVLTLSAASGTFSGVMEDGGIAGGTGGVFGVRGGTLTLTGVSTFHGTVANASNATLALAGNGSIANAIVSQGGTFDISQTTSGTAIAGLGNGGIVALGSKTLTIAITTSPTLPWIYDGEIQDGGIAGGSGGGIVIASGVQWFSGTTSYTGPTTISGGTLVLMKSDVITSSSGVVDNGTLDISQGGASIKTLSGTGIVALGEKTLTLTAESGTFSGIIQDGGVVGAVGGTFSGGKFIPNGGALNLAGGTLILTGANTYTGGTTISAGTLQMGPGGSLASTGALAVNGGTFDLNGQAQTVGALSGTGGFITLGSGALTTSSTVNTTLANVINGSGSLTLAGTGTLTLTGVNTYTGGTTINAGRLQIGSGGISGAIAGNVIDNGTLAFNRSDSVSFANVISGSGAVTQAGTGILILMGANTYTGGTTIGAGTLRIGPGGSLASTGALAVNGGTFDLDGQTQTFGALSGTGGFITLGAGSLTANSAASTTLASVISGVGSLTKAGTGALTLSGANTYTGGTAINAGTLNVAGTLAAVSVASGGTLIGTGNVGTTSVASGGILSPGVGGATGTLRVTGNLTLASGASYINYFTPTATGLTAVTGTAGVNGTLTANAASGIYTAGQRYTLITATGGLSGTFASFTTPNLPAYVTGRLSYDANNVFLNLDANEITSSLGGTATTNQTSITTGLDVAVKSGKAPNSGITSLFTLSGASLGTALNQATGDIGAKASQAAGQSFSPFFNVLMGRGETNDGTRVAATGVPDGVMPAQLEEGATDIWGSIYGGHTSIAADAATGAASLSSGAFGIAGGLETMFGDELLAGASIGFGHQTFRSGGSSGESNDVMLGLYGRKNFGQGYVAAAIGYGWHDITTARTVTLSGTDILSGKFTADDFAGRIESGYRLALDEQMSITPFAAFAGDLFHTPAYTETTASGSANFALAYAANDSTASHAELGGRLNRDFAIDAQTLSLEGLLAWAHQTNSRPSAQAAFADLPGSGFVLLGVKPATDTALLGLGLQMHDTSGLVYGARVQDQTGGGTEVITGTLNLALHW